MKTRTLLSTAVLAIVALAFTASAVGQSPTPPTPPGLGIHWQIALTGATARDSGIAVYETFRASLAPPATANGPVYKKFTVETVTPSVRDGEKLDVFLGPSTDPREPYGKLVGTIDVSGGFGAMILSAAKVPVIVKGTTVSIVSHQETAAGELILKGTF